MGRKRKTRSLDVWMNGERVGRWTLATAGHEFTYSESWLRSDRARPLSLTMPLTAAPYRGDLVESWFDNLLPDSQAIRERVQARFAAASGKAFDLLAEIGRDCVGAIQLLDPGQEPAGVREIRADAVTDAQIAQLLREQVRPSAPGYRDPFRISLAGAQEKTALLMHQGTWHVPLDSTPTSHILKLPLGNVGTWQADLSTSVENEWLCARIVREFGLPIASCEIDQFEDQRVLVVQRFDRRLAPDGSWWLRLPQEDLCQATRTPAALKYEADGGPGIRTVLDLLLGSSVAADDRRMFLTAQVVFWLLAAIDGHAKNFSIALLPRGRFRLTPLYDVISAHPVVGSGGNRVPVQDLRLAMAVWGENRHYRWDAIQRRHWLATASACGMSAVVEAVLADLLDRVPRVIATVADDVPAGFPPEVLDPVLRGVERAAARLA